MPGAGILPVAFHKNKIYFLFGRENKYNDTPGGSDFGGGIEKGESIMEANLREIEEETCGFIQSEEIIESIYRNGKLLFTMSPGGRKYTTTLVKIQYDERLPYYFNKTRSTINKYVNPKIIKTNVIFEKDQLVWISMEEIRRLSYRSFYWNMIQILIENRQKIERFVK